jgi:hypothetical protein
VDGFNIFTVNEIDSVGVNNSTVIGLALNFEVVGDQADGASGIHSVGRLEGRVAELATSSASAPTTALVATVALIVAIGAPSLAAAIWAIALVIVATTAALPLVVVASLVMPTLVEITISTTAHELLLRGSTATHVVLLLLLLPGLMALIALVGVEATLVVLVLATSHVLLAGGTSLPVLLLVLVVSGVVVLLIVVLHSYELVVLISKTEARFLICFAVVTNGYLKGKSFSSGLLLACLMAFRELSESE